MNQEIKVKVDQVLNDCGFSSENFEKEKELLLLNEDIGLDSLDVVDVIVRLETHYNISIPDEEVEIETLGELYTLIEKYAPNPLSN